MKQQKGRLIVFEGTDGSGKSTQFRRLCLRLEAEGKSFHRLVFPQYEEESSALIRMYLRGEFGSKPSDVNPYAASAFYAVDRYAAYKKYWGEEYRGGGLILADRYTTSNAVHQASKLEGQARKTYIDWLFDFEHVKMGLPEPDLVIYLDLPVEQSLDLLKKRQEEAGEEHDIHEADSTYLMSCRNAALEAAKQYGWTIVCALDDGGALRSVEDIHQEIWQVIQPCLE